MLTVSLIAVTLMGSQPTPSFDCARARSETEIAICSDRDLATLDRRLAEAYARARSRLSNAGRAALAEDQRIFLRVRDASFSDRDQPWMEGFPNLSDRIGARIALLDRIESRADGVWVGAWANEAGAIHIKRAVDGRLRAELSAAEPLNGRWICQTTITGRVENGRLHQGAQRSGNPAISLEVRQGVLIVRETWPDAEGGQPDYCGHNGGLEGRYFSVRGD